MAQLRRQLRLAIQLYETTNENRLKTGDPLTAELYPSGAQIEVITTMDPGIGVTTAVSCSGRGSLAVAQNVRLIRSSGGVWADISTTDFIIDTIEESKTAEGVFVYTLENTSATTTFATAAGDRIVAKREVANQVTIYEDESDTTDTVTNPVDVPENGVIEGYVDERGLDVFLTGSTITDNWTAFNVATHSGEIGPMRLKAETLAANTLVNVDADTTVLLLDTDTAAITLIEHCAPGRVLIVYPGIASLQMTTLNTKADDSIYEASGRTIDLDQDEPLMLVGNEASANVAYWSILGTPALIDLGLDGLSDVATSGAAAGEPLVYDGANWGPADVIGTAAAPMTTVYVADNGLILGVSGASAKFTTSNLTANRVYSLPNTSTVLMGLTENADISGLKRFIVGASGMKMSEIGYSRIAEFDVSGITAATTRVFTFPDKDGTFAVLTDLKTGISSLDDVSISTPLVSQSLKWNGTNWINSNSLGSGSADGIHTVYLDITAAINLWDSSTFFSKWYDGPDAGKQTGVTTATILPAHDGGIVLVDEFAPLTMTRVFQFDNTSATKWGVFQELLVTRNAGFLMRVPPTSRVETTGIIIKRVTWDWVLLAAGSASTATELNLYHAASGSYPSATTVPPAGTAILSANMLVPTGATVMANSGTESFADATIPADNLIYLGVAVNNDEPAAIGTLTLSVEYVLTALQA